MDTCLDLIALQYTCMIVMAMLAFFVFVSRYYVTCRNRQFEQSRWMIVVALLLFVVHYMCQMRLGWRQQGNDVGVLFNLLFYSPSAILLSWSQLNILRAGHRRWSFMRNRALTTIEDSYPLPSDQILTNSICIDENGGVYVASNSRTPGGKGLMQKLICKDGKISTSQADGAWQAYYDGGPQAPCIKLGHGTGSTPTLMGFGQDKDKLVVITDGSKRMKLVAFWRDEIPSDAQQVAGYDKRIAGVHEVTCGLGTSTEWIQSEQSVVVGGYDAFVVNNINVTNQEINDKIIGVIAIGPIVKGPQGAECVRWNTKEKKWESKWTRSDVSSVSMIPAVSIKSEMVFVCGWNDASGWEVTGLDWKSGATRHRSILGKNNRANGAYAIIQYLANGDLLFNSVAGPIRVKY